MKLCDTRMGLWIGLAVALVTALSVAGAFGRTPDGQAPAEQVHHD